MDFYRAHGRNAALTCRYFGISRQTFYRWKRRYDPHDLTRLEDRSHRPRRLRQPTWTAERAERVLALRCPYPRWGKDKLVVLLRCEGRSVSTSMVGRILGRLKRRGVPVEPPPLRRKARRGPRPYAVRKPGDWPIRQPGDLVDVDTLELRPLPGVVFKQFTTRDVVSRWDVVEAHRRATWQAAARLLDTLLGRRPFAVRTLQVDAGSEFAATCEAASQERGLKLFVLPPHSPKLNGYVENAPIAPTRRSPMGSPLLAPDRPARPGTPTVRAGLQPGSSSPSLGLLNSSAVPRPAPISIQADHVSPFYRTGTAR